MGNFQLAVSLYTCEGNMEDILNPLIVKKSLKQKSYFLGHPLVLKSHRDV